MALELIAHGAESKLWRNGDRLIKKRVRKSYRVKELDERLRYYRNKREVKALRRARALIKVPRVIEVSDYEIVMEFISGSVLRDVINDLSSESFKTVCRLIGNYVRRLHEADLVHGDLTTSNMIIHEDELFFIDFGLSEVSKKLDDKAVDLHVLGESLKSKHYAVYEQAWRLIKESYGLKPVLDRLRIVELRGRKKIKV